MRVIVTGGAGFIGSHLVDALIERGDEVLVIDNLSTGKRENINPRARFFKRDICRFWSMRSLFESVDYVFHLAALARVLISRENPYETHKVNVDGTVNVLWASVCAEVKKVIYSSSSSVYGPQATLPLKEEMIPAPISPYGDQKLYDERCCRAFTEAYGLRVTCLRYFNVYGRRQSDDSQYSSVIGKFLKNNQGRKLSVIYDGNQSRDFTHVSDVVIANILAMESPRTGLGEAINIGAGNGVSINQLAQMIGGLYTHEGPRPGDIKHSLADISKAKELLGWKPRISLNEGITQLKKLYGIV